MKKLTFDEYLQSNPGDVVAAVGAGHWLQEVGIVQEKSMIARRSKFIRIFMTMLGAKKPGTKFYKFSGVEPIKYENIPDEYPWRDIYVGVSMNKKNTLFKIIGLDQARRETRQLWWIKEDDLRINTMTNEEFFERLGKSFDRYVDAVLWTWEENKYTDDKSPSRLLFRGLYEDVLEAREKELKNNEGTKA